MPTRLLQEVGLVYLLKPGDHQAGADGDSFNMAGVGHATIVIGAAAVPLAATVARSR